MGSTVLVMINENYRYKEKVRYAEYCKLINL